MSKLTDKQEAFCREYIIDFIGKQAAIRAGYSEDTAEVQASRLLSYAKVQKRLSQLIGSRNNRTQITADTVLENLHQMAMLDIGDVLYDNGEVKPISEWTKDWRIAIGGLDVNEQTSFGGSEDGKSVVSINTIKKIKGIDKVRVWELIGKHTDVNAWKERVDHQHSGYIKNEPLSKEELAERLKKLENEI